MVLGWWGTWTRFVEGIGNGIHIIYQLKHRHCATALRPPRGAGGGFTVITYIPIRGFIDCNALSVRCEGCAVGHTRERVMLRQSVEFCPNSRRVGGPYKYSFSLVLIAESCRVGGLPLTLRLATAHTQNATCLLVTMSSQPSSRLGSRALLTAAIMLRCRAVLCSTPLSVCRDPSRRPYSRRHHLGSFPFH